MSMEESIDRSNEGSRFIASRSGIFLDAGMTRLLAVLTTICQVAVAKP
jgi:hypothetical protein